MKRTLILIVLAVACFSAPPATAFDEVHGAKGIPKLNYDSLFAEATTLKNSTAGLALVAQCLKRYGGTEHLEQLARVRLTYRMKAFLNRDTLDVVKTFQHGLNYRIDRSGGIVDETRILNAAQSWFVGPDTMIVLDAGRYKAELFSYLTLTMPLGIRSERFDEIRYGTRDGDSLSYVYMQKNDTLMIIVGIDPVDHLVKSTEGLIRQGTDGFVFINHFADHREHDGYVFAYSLTNISLGLKVAQSTLVEVKINPTLSDKTFLPSHSDDPRKVY
jgi:hypothetical protein